MRGAWLPLCVAVGLFAGSARWRAANRRPAKETLAAAEFVTTGTNEDAVCGVLEVVRAVLAAQA